MIADGEAQIVAEAIDATIDKLSTALGVPRPTVDAKAWADSAPEPADGKPNPSRVESVAR